MPSLHNDVETVTSESLIDDSISQRVGRWGGGGGVGASCLKNKLAQSNMMTKMCFHFTSS